MVGDFNCHLETQSSDSIDFRNCSDAAQLHIVNTGPSSHQAKIPSWLDVLLVNHPENVIHFLKSDIPFIDFHDSITLTYSLLKTSKVITNTVSFRNFKYCDHPNFNTDIKVTLAKHTHDLDSKSFSAVLRSLNSDLLSILDRYAPITTFTPKPNYNPWITANVIAQIKKRNRFYLIYNKTRSPKYYEAWKK